MTKYPDPLPPFDYASIVKAISWIENCYDVRHKNNVDAKKDLLNLAHFAREMME